MLSYIKSIAAVGLALLATLVAGLWLQARASTARNLAMEAGDLQRQVQESEARAELAGRLDTQLKATETDLASISSRFARKDHEGIQLVEALVDAASTSGIAMTKAAEISPRTEVSRMKNTSAPVNVVTYRISLEGTYVGLVRFFQAVAAWKLENIIESLTISAPVDGAIETVQAELTIAVFSGEN